MALERVSLARVLASPGTHALESIRSETIFRLSCFLESHVINNIILLGLFLEQYQHICKEMFINRSV